MSTMLKATAGLLLIGVGVTAGFFLGRSDREPIATRAPASEATRKVLYWYDPMAPEQHFDRPGRSPFMDMELVPKYADGAAEPGVRIDSGARQNLGVRTAFVEVGRLATSMRVPGTLTWDLREESVVSARVDAQVTDVYEKVPFARVRAGDPLVSLLSPAWQSAIAESKALGRARSDEARDLQDAAQERLRVLGVPSNAMDASGRISLTAPRDGVVIEVTVREGQFVTAGTPLFRINGTRTLWLDAFVPQAATSTLEPGTPVRVVDGASNEEYEGEVESLLPRIDEANRTQTARIVVRNPDGRLVPGTFVQVELRPEADDPRPLVPSESLITSGAESRVILVGDDGSFHPRQVRAGRSGGGKTEIVEGLSGGEQIVVSGQFLIDSEANLSGALRRLEESSPDASQPASSDCPVQYWYDPMKPDRHFDAPGKSPFMDMQLVPRFAPGADASCTVDDVEPVHEGHSP